MPTDTFFPLPDCFPYFFSWRDAPLCAVGSSPMAERPVNPSFCLTNEGFPTNHQPLNRDRTSF